MLPVIVPPIRKGICRFIIDFKIASKLRVYIYRQHAIIIVVVAEFFSVFFLCFDKTYLTINF